MGGAASSSGSRRDGGQGGPSERPIERPGLGVNGTVTFHDASPTRGGTTNARKSSSSSTTRPDHEQSSLQHQAAAHWHKIISHSVEQSRQGVYSADGHSREYQDGDNDDDNDDDGDDENGAGGYNDTKDDIVIQRPRCPECARGNPNGPTCRICGKTAEERAREKEDTKVVARVRWNASKQAYERILENEATGAISAVVQSPQSPSRISGSRGQSQTPFPSATNRTNPSTPKSASSGNTSPLSSPVNGGSLSSGGDNRRQSRLLEDDGSEKRHQVVGMLLESEATRRRKSSVSAMTLMGAQARLEEIEVGKQRQEAQRQRQMEQSKALESVDRKVRHAAAMNNPLQLLRAGSAKGKGKHGVKALIGESDMADEQSGSEDDEGHEAPLRGNKGGDGSTFHRVKGEDTETGPEPPLPGVIITLKSRTIDSITLAWDVDAPAMQMLEAVKVAYGGKKEPSYQLSYKLHDDSKTNWKIGCYRTRTCGGTVSNLLANTQYVFKCRRIGWDREWGDPVVIRTGPGVPTAPQAVTAKEVTSTSIFITWRPPETDNGLPVTEYIISMKPYGQPFTEFPPQRERVYVATGLNPNQICIFEVCASNKVGRGPPSERFACRTMAPGSADMTPWVEAVDERTNKLYFTHPKTNAIAWALPKGALIDQAASFRSKRAYLIRRISAKKQEACIKLGVQAHVNQLQVSRRNILEDSVQRLNALSAVQVDGGPIRIRFDNEDGMDAGGLAKDWFAAVSKAFLNGAAGLLQLLPSGVVTIDQRAKLLLGPSESRFLFKALGIFIAKAIQDNQTLGLLLSPLILLALTEKQPSLEDLKDLEPEFYKGLLWVMDNDITDADLVFTTSVELFDETQVINLKDAGGEEGVTEENKEEYIELMVEWLCKKRYEPGLGYLVQGFQQHLSPEDMQHFTPEELQTMLGGHPDIDAADINKDVQYAGGFSASSDQVVWLWSILADFDQKTLCKFLAFVTGCPCLPIDGLSPPLLLTQSADGDDLKLPVAHTCKALHKYKK
jgi:HECT-domain (ubiquitin-transferase)/Fibronectin type III domain